MYTFILLVYNISVFIIVVETIHKTWQKVVSIIRLIYIYKNLIHNKTADSVSQKPFKHI